MTDRPSESTAASDIDDSEGNAETVLEEKVQELEEIVENQQETIQALEEQLENITTTVHEAGRERGLIRRDIKELKRSGGSIEVNPWNELSQLELWASEVEEVPEEIPKKQLRALGLFKHIMRVLNKRSKRGKTAMGTISGQYTGNLRDDPIKEVMEMATEGNPDLDAKQVHRALKELQKLSDGKLNTEDKAKNGSTMIKLEKGAELVRSPEEFKERFGVDPHAFRKELN